MASCSSSASIGIIRSSSSYSSFSLIALPLLLLVNVVEGLKPHQRLFMLVTPLRQFQEGGMEEALTQESS